MLREIGREYAPEEIVFSQGEIADALFVIQEGRVKLLINDSGHEHPLEILTQGSLFGEVALFTASKKRQHTARVLERSRILRVDEKLILSQLHLDPSLGFRLIRQMSQRIQDQDLKLVALSHRHPEWHPSDPQESGSPSDLAEMPKTLPKVYDFSVGHHVLFVEDDPEFMQIVRLGLENLKREQTEFILSTDCSMTHAATLGEALAWLNKEKFDVVVLDLNLPDSEGLDTVRRFYNACPDTPIIVLSAEEEDHLALAAIQLGAQDFLVKHHVHSKDIARAMRFAMERRLMLVNTESQPIEIANLPSSRWGSWLNQLFHRKATSSPSNPGI